MRLKLRIEKAVAVEVTLKSGWDDGGNRMWRSCVFFLFHLHILSHLEEWREAAKTEEIERSVWLLGKYKKIWKQWKRTIAVKWDSSRWWSRRIQGSGMQLTNLETVRWGRRGGQSTFFRCSYSLRFLFSITLFFLFKLTFYFASKIIILINNSLFLFFWAQLKVKKTTKTFFLSIKKFI